MITVNTNDIPDQGLPLRAGLWLAQALLAGVYLPTGIAALFLPAAQVLAIAPWAGHLPEQVLMFICAADLAAGLGVLLPSLTRIAPKLAVLAAVCSAALQGIAIFFHALFGVLPTPLPVNLAVIALSVFVAWGRSGKAAITPLRQERDMSAMDAFASEQADRSADRRGARRRAALRHKISSNEGIRIQRGMRGTPSRHAKVQRRFCNE
ncbi:MAG: DoxX family protein [Gammaproteobacteria bacterium]